jgi:hypothetical protein
MTRPVALARQLSQSVAAEAIGVSGSSEIGGTSGGLVGVAGSRGVPPGRSVEIARKAESSRLAVGAPSRAMPPARAPVAGSSVPRPGDQRSMAASQARSALPAPGRWDVGTGRRASERTRSKASSNP